MVSDQRCENNAKRVSSIYKPFPRQEEFHRSPAKYRLFGGAAGPGKTKALLWEAILQAIRYPGADTLLLRRTLPELEDSLLREFRRSVPRDLYAKYNDAKHIVRWHNGSTTKFGYCKSENDVYQYQGGEFLFIGLDELTFFTLKQWQFLTSRNRCPIPGTFATMAGASNPGNIGHAWVKACWIDKVPPPGFDRSDLYDPTDYDFIRARISDNPIYANDLAYRKTLEALPEHLRRAFMEGDWSVFAGQYFDIFDKGRHSEEIGKVRIEEWWPKWISIDWGFNHPSAVYWHTLQPASDRNPERAITYREFVKNQLSPTKLGQEIAWRSGHGTNPYGLPSKEKIQKIFLSPDAFAHRTAEASIAEQIGQVLDDLGMPMPDAADDDRIGGWQLMYQLFERDAWLIVSGNGEKYGCPKLIEKLPTLIYDDKHTEDVMKVDGDDEADSARYGMVSWFGKVAPRAPLEVRVTEATKHLTDPTQRAMQVQKIVADESRKNAPVSVVRGRNYGPKRWRGMR